MERLEHHSRGGMVRTWLDYDFGSDDGLILDAVLPVQFDDVWRRKGPLCAEHALALSVVWQAIADLRVPRHRRGRDYGEAREWVGSDDRKWPYSFLNLCDALGLPWKPLRDALLSDSLPAEMPEGCRRGVKQAA